MTIIKICGIMDPDLAYQSAKAGAHFIGIVYHPGSKRHVDSCILGAEIATAAKEGGASPVLVVKDCPETAIVERAYACTVETVQMHGAFAELPSSFIRILANAGHGLNYRNQDFVLLDNQTPGSGQRLDWPNLRAPLHSKWILSGGLTPDNVAEGIQLFKPDGVDVSSGVELNGSKDLKLIRRFIDAVRKSNNQ